ncbi:MAG: exodeoxyribonuclease VII small subunit [Tidjanibacter sp.]|nr:exodeoxyribonuclease VII small subunit [Tidjanibacter sp.]
MENKEISYSEALAELEAILQSIESANTDIDSLAAKVARANELIKFCRQRLLKVEEEVKAALEN